MARALLIGINYEGSGNSLNGCINDVEHMKLELIKRGYPRENITVLTDHTNPKPTKRVILTKLLELILSGDSRLFFHFSGHGSFVNDVGGDEEDRKDECLVPIDCDSGELIIDDEIRGILCCLTEKQRLICVIDACHSGTSFDLKYNLYERYAGGGLIMKNDFKHLETRGECIMFSGCMDSEFSSDAFIGGESQGAMTYSFLKALESSSNTYDSFIRQIRKLLKEGGYSQVPNLSSGKYLNLSSKVVF